MSKVNYKLKPRVIALHTTGPTELRAGYLDEESWSMALQAVDKDGRRIYVKLTDEQIRHLVQALTNLRTRDWYRKRYINVDPGQ